MLEQVSIFVSWLLVFIVSLVYLPFKEVCLHLLNVHPPFSSSAPR